MLRNRRGDEKTPPKEDPRIEKERLNTSNRAQSAGLGRAGCAETATGQFGTSSMDYFDCSPVERELLENGTWNDIMEEVVFRVRTGREHDIFTRQAIHNILNDLNTPKRR